MQTYLDNGADTSRNENKQWRLLVAEVKENYSLTECAPHHSPLAETYEVALLPPKANVVSDGEEVKQ